MLAAALVLALLLAATAFGATNPPAPTGLTATTPTRVAPVLHWNAVADASGGYRVFRGNTQIGVGTSTAASFTDGSVAADGSYAYAVQAEDWAGNLGAWSPPLTLIVDRTAPSTPPAPSPAAAVTGSAPQLSWPASFDAGVGISGYR